MVKLVTKGQVEWRTEGGEAGSREDEGRTEVLVSSKDTIRIGKVVLDKKLLCADNGRRRTESLFVEIERKGNKYPPLFTLKQSEDLPTGEISMHRVYMEIADPTEFRTAKALLGSYQHWNALCEKKWFKEELNKWRLELAAKLESDAIIAIKEVLDDPDAKGRLQAAKMIAERPWEKKDKVPLRGRPSKAEIEGYKKRVAADTEDTNEDYKRILGE